MWIVWECAPGPVLLPQHLSISDFLNVSPVPVQASLLGLHSESALNIAEGFLETATLSERMYNEDNFITG